MNNLDDIDLGLWYKSIVLLDEDKSSTVATDELIPTPSEKVASPKVENTPSESGNTIKEEVAKKLLVYPDRLKLSLFIAGSNLNKTCTALKLDSLYNAPIAFEEITDFNELSSCTHI